MDGLEMSSEHGTSSHASQTLQVEGEYPEHWSQLDFLGISPLKYQSQT